MFNVIPETCLNRLNRLTRPRVFFLTDRMERRKICGASSLSVAMRVVVIGMFIVAGACATLDTLQLTKETHTGKSRQTPGTGSQEPADRKSNKMALTLFSFRQMRRKPHWPAKRQKIKLTRLEWAEPTVPDHRPKYLWSASSLGCEGHSQEAKTQAACNQCGALITGLQACSWCSLGWCQSRQACRPNFNWKQDLSNFVLTIRSE